MVGSKRSGGSVRPETPVIEAQIAGATSAYERRDRRDLLRDVEVEELDELGEHRRVERLGVHPVLADRPHDRLRV